MVLGASWPQTLASPTHVHFIGMHKDQRGSTRLQGRSGAEARAGTGSVCAEGDTEAPGGYRCQEHGSPLGRATGGEQSQPRREAGGMHLAVPRAGLPRFPPHLPWVLGVDHSFSFGLLGFGLALTLFLSLPLGWDVYSEPQYTGRSRPCF